MGKKSKPDFSYRLQTSLRHIRNRLRACCSDSNLAFNSEAFGLVATFGAFGSSGTEADVEESLVLTSDETDKAASIRLSKNNSLSSVDGVSTWYLTMQGRNRLSN